MKLGVVWLIGFALGVVFGLLTFIGAGLGVYWILIGGLVIGFLTGFLLKQMGKSLGFGFLSAFLGFTVGGIIVVVALAPFLTAIPFLGGFLGILIVIVAVVFGIGAGILALIGAPIGVLVGKRMASAAQQPSAIAPPPSMRSPRRHSTRGRQAPPNPHGSLDGRRIAEDREEQHEPFERPERQDSDSPRRTARRRDDQLNQAA